MEIYVADIRMLAENRQLEYLERQLPRERRKRIAGYHKQADKIRSIGAGLLLEYGLRKRGYTLCFDAPERKPLYIAYGAYGKPYCPDAPELYFNLSHGGAYVAAAFDTAAVGIDIEHCRSARLAVAARFFTAEEAAYLQALCTPHGTEKALNRAFMWLWTRKESYIKAVGEGMHLPLHTFCVLSDTVADDRESYYLKSFPLPGEGMLSVCAKHAIQAKPVEIDLAKAFDCGS